MTIESFRFKLNVNLNMLLVDERRMSRGNAACLSSTADLPGLQT